MTVSNLLSTKCSCDTCVRVYNYKHRVDYTTVHYMVYIQYATHYKYKKSQMVSSHSWSYQCILNKDEQLCVYLAHLAELSTVYLLLRQQQTCYVDVSVFYRVATTRLFYRNIVHAYWSHHIHVLSSKYTPSVHKLSRDATACFSVTTNPLYSCTHNLVPKPGSSRLSFQCSS